MLTMSYINNLVKLKLDELAHHSDNLTGLKTGVSVSREGDRVLIFHQPNHQRYPATVYVYRKTDIWILEYYLLVTIPDEIEDCIIDAWLTQDHVGFIIKLCNIGDERNGISYHYALKDDEYVLAVTKRNTRIEFDEQPYFIEGAF